MISRKKIFKTIALNLTLLSHIATASLYVLEEKVEKISLQSGRPVASKDNIGQFNQINRQNCLDKK